MKFQTKCKMWSICKQSFIFYVNYASTEAIYFSWTICIIIQLNMIPKTDYLAGCLSSASNNIRALEIIFEPVYVPY